MKRHTARVLYYTSVSVALIAILVSAVIINRTLVNTPEFNIEEISETAGETVSAYMAYVDDNDNMIIGIAEEAEDVAEIRTFIQGVNLGDMIEVEHTEVTIADGWVIFYDKDGKIASRMNFYNGGTLIWYDGEHYQVSADIMDMMMAYCDKYTTADEEEIPAETETVNGTEETDD